MKITRDDLINWIDRPPSNDDLDLCNYIIDLQQRIDKAIEWVYIVQQNKDNKHLSL